MSINFEILEKYCTLFGFGYNRSNCKENHINLLIQDKNGVFVTFLVNVPYSGLCLDLVK